MFILDFLFPRKCVGCSIEGNYICATCFSYLDFIDSFFCTVCQRASFNGLTHPGCKKSRLEIDGVFAVIGYKGVVKNLIHKFKYKPFLFDLAGTINEIFYEGIIQKELLYKLFEEDNIFTPIPLHKDRFRERGYNQSQIIGRALAQKINDKNRSNSELIETLRRIRATMPQFGLSLQDRCKNIDKAFEINIATKTKIKNKRIFLIDDIVTTGSTFREAAKILKINGAREVYGLAFAHGQ